MARGAPRRSDRPDARAGRVDPRGRRRVAVLLAALAVVMPAAVAVGCDSGERPSSGAAPPVPEAGPSSRWTVRQAVHQAWPSGQPNIVFVLTDDLTTSLVRFMPHVREMKRRGVTFDRYYVASPLCCPSRASILTGAHPHTTGVLTNADGWQSFRGGWEQHTFATALDAAGYRTGFVGKYMNGYDTNVPHKGPGPVPPGWDEWYAGDGLGRSQYQYRLNENGRYVRYGSRPQDYGTDVLADKAVSFVTRAGRRPAPFLLQVSTNAPHGPSVPPRRYADAFTGLHAPRPPSFDVPLQNPPRGLAGLPPLTQAQVADMDGSFRRRAQSALAIDDLLAQVQRALRQTGEADDTYVVFSSDNGFHMGQYRLPMGKRDPYETDLRVPLVVTGPGVAAGRHVRALASGIDLAPTFERVGDLRVSRGREGRSLLPWLRGQRPSGWRRALIAEMPEWIALRTARATWVRHRGSSVREYYDLGTDPYQMVNAAGTLSAHRRALLDVWVDALERCRGAACRVADRAP